MKADPLNFTGAWDVRQITHCKEFSEEGGITRLCYFIDFDPRLPFTLLGPVLKSAIEKPIRKSLEKLSKRYAP